MENSENKITVVGRCKDLTELKQLAYDWNSVVDRIYEVLRDAEVFDEGLVDQIAVLSWGFDYYDVEDMVCVRWMGFGMIDNFLFPAKYLYMGCEDIRRDWEERRRKRKEEIK